MTRSTIFPRASSRGFSMTGNSSPAGINGRPISRPTVCPGGSGSSSAGVEPAVREVDEKALAWLRKATAQGHAGAKKVLKDIGER